MDVETKSSTSSFINMKGGIKIKEDSLYIALELLYGEKQQPRSWRVYFWIKTKIIL